MVGPARGMETAARPILALVLAIGLYAIRRELGAEPLHDPSHLLVAQGKNRPAVREGVYNCRVGRTR